MFRLRNVMVFLVSGVLLFGVAGCTIIFQKGRRSDVEKIRELQDEVDRLSQIRAELEEQLKGIKGVSLSMEDRGLVITFLDEVLFDSGKAKIKSDAFSALDKVSAVITEKAADFDIGVEGHTDNVPIKFSGWKSNWELSTARATSVLHYLVDKGVSPGHLAAIGYGEFRPVAANDSLEGRRKNRRVEIVILPELRKVVPGAAETSASDTKMLEPAENLK
ncbi:MAG: OmpA family protein [Candidatus Omnitrophica bacterium]|nr:OmpA family protein [Candidatus Omnitrophota bacterium]MDD5574141.1 OmpA family protein [Candidatus Omnitrophota bacterium]